MTAPGRAIAVHDDGADAAWIAGAAATRGIDLFSLGSNWLAAARVASALRSAGLDVADAPSARLLDDEAARLAVDLPRWTDALAAAAAGDLETGGVSAFWLGSIAERNPLKCRELHQIAQARAFDRHLAVSAYARCVIAVGDPALAEALAGIARARGIPNVDVAAGARPSASLRGAIERRPLAASAAVLARQVAWSVAARGLAFARAALPPGALLFVSYFPYVDRQAADAGRFRNRMAGPLQDAIAESGRVPYWALLFVFIDGWTFAQAVALVRRLRAAGERVALLDAFFGPAAWMRVLRDARTIARRGAALESRHRALIERGLVPEGAGGLARALWRRATSGPDVVRGLYYREVFARLVEAVPARDIVYYAEFQGWEQALNAAGARAGARRIGYQHTHVARHHYFYFRTAAETSGTGSRMPLPSVVAANGEVTRRLLSESGFETLTTLECVRQMHLASIQPAVKPAAPTLLVAGSIDRVETLALLSLVAAAFPAGAPLRIVVKAHPSQPAAPLFETLGINPASAGYEMVEGTVGEALAGATIALVGSSAVAIEALAYGCDVIVPVTAAFISMSPVTGFDEWHHRVFSPADLRAAVERILAGGPAKTPAEKLAFVHQYWLLDPALPRWRALLEGKQAA